MKNTPGKGQFSRRAVPDGVVAYETRWYAPYTLLTRESLVRLLRFVSDKGGDSAFHLLGSLAATAPPYRLARNLGVLIRQSAAETVTDALQQGLSAQESAALADLERWGVPLDLLSAAHALLNVRERQRVLVEGVMDMFEVARTDAVVLTADEVDSLKRG